MLNTPSFSYHDTILVQGEIASSTIPPPTSFVTTLTCPVVVLENSSQTRDRNADFIHTVYDPFVVRNFVRCRQTLIVNNGKLGITISPRKLKCVKLFHNESV